MQWSSKEGLDIPISLRKYNPKLSGMEEKDSYSWSPTSFELRLAWGESRILLQEKKQLTNLEEM